MTDLISQAIQYRGTTGITGSSYFFNNYCLMRAGIAEVTYLFRCSSLTPIQCKVHTIHILRYYHIHFHHMIRHVQYQVTQSIKIDVIPKKLFKIVLVYPNDGPFKKKYWNYYINFNVQTDQMNYFSKLPNHFIVLYFSAISYLSTDYTPALERFKSDRDVAFYIGGFEYK